MANTYTKSYADGSSLTEAQLDSAYQTLQLDIANSALMTTGSALGQALLSNGSGTAASFQSIPDPQGPFSLRNYGLKATVATGVMTISLVTKAGTAPSGTDKVDFNYSTNGTTSASYTTVQIGSATSLAVNASATLGAGSTSAQAIYVYGYYNTAATAVKLAVSRRGDLDRGTSSTFTAMAASSDSASAIYASAALTAMPRLLGTVMVSQSSAGAWQTSSKVNITNNIPASLVDFNRASTTSAAKIGQVAIAASTSGSFSTSSTSYVDVTNVTVTITTSGRPTVVSVCPLAGSSASFVGLNTAAGGGASTQKTALLSIVRTASGSTVSTRVGCMSMTNNLAANELFYTTPQMTVIDTSVAGTYTFKLQAQMASGYTATTVEVRNVKIVAYEL